MFEVTNSVDIHEYNILPLWIKESDGVEDHYSPAVRRYVFNKTGYDWFPD